MSDKVKYILIWVLSLLLVFATVFAIRAVYGYLCAVEMEKYNSDEFENEEFAVSAEHLLNNADSASNRDATLRYFDDAVFIGDSRTEGLFLYSDIAKKTKATPYAYRGFTTADILENEKFLSDGEYLSAVQMLENNKNFSKVYIMLGVNELSPAGAGDFMARYKKIVDTALKINPSARIFVQSIIPMAQWKSDVSSYINNENAKKYNKELMGFAEQNGYIWLDVASVLSTPDGALDKAYDCGDGLHLTPHGCDVWFEYLCYYTYE